MVSTNAAWGADESGVDDIRCGQLLATRLVALASRVEDGNRPNPTALLCIRNAKISGKARLRYRADWISKLIRRRRGTNSYRLLDLLETAYALIVARQCDLSDSYLSRNRIAGAELAEKLLRIQPGRSRLSHYCSRRTGPDPELLAVEFFARALDWPHIEGAEDYLAAMYCICRQPNLRYRFDAEAGSKLRELAAAWVAATDPVAPSPFLGELS